jgi:hypothetical protein
MDVPGGLANRGYHGKTVPVLACPPGSTRLGPSRIGWHLSGRELERRRRHRLLVELLDQLDVEQGPVDESLVAKYVGLLG